MLKNFINRVKNLVEQNKDNKEFENEKEIILKEENVISKEIKEIDLVQKEEIIENINKKEEIIKKDKLENKNEDKDKIIEIVKENIKISNVDIVKNKEEKNNIENIELTNEDLEYIKEIKIKRGSSIRAIDVYTKESQIFKTHKECSKKLKVPMEYIKENLKYGYTDYLGEAIKYLAEELKLDKTEYVNYLDNIKTPSQILTLLNNKIFTSKISDDKRDEILCNEKIEPIKMHYMFECIDEEYDDYFIKYKSIIKRGGKKKIELVDKKGEVIEIFKSLDECATFLNKEKNEVVDMLKYKQTKVGRYEIRYSLRNI